MLSTRLMNQFLHKESLLSIFMWLMGFGILILLDSLATIWLASKLGAYLALALVGIMTWVSLGVVFLSLSRHIQRIRTLAARGAFSPVEYMHVCGLVLSAILIITPGLLSDLMAWVLFFQPFRLGCGAVVYHRFSGEFEELNQHLSTEEP